MKKKTGLFTGSILCTAILMSANSWAEGMKTYEVTLTNLTPGQPMAPVMIASHRAGMSFFTPGEAPSVELADLAEAGNGKPIAEKLLTMHGVTAAVTGTGGTPPGGSSTTMIKAKSWNHISLGAMLGNTNDAFVAAVDVDLPKGKQVIKYMLSAYDAGTETNDESCTTVPGPACGGVALSPDDNGEGIVTIHNGIHGIDGLSAALYDWNNPVAMITIKRVN